MSVKGWALVVLTLVFGYETVLQAVGYQSMRRPIPESVADVYDREKYAKWRAYHRDQYQFAFVKNAVLFLVNAALIWTNAYAWAARLAAENVYAQLLAVVGLSILVDAILDGVFSYVHTMVIEEKHGFNRTTMKTFLADQAKGLLVSAVVECGLVSIFALIHTKLGNWTPVLFSAVLVAIMFAVIFLYPVLSKLFNKFVPLEDGELKERLTALLNQYGYKVKGIEVVQASERTTKANAYFSGYGRMKTIVLYDNLLATLTTDEIVAVFAHEMGHGLHHDTVRNNGINVLMFVMLAAALFACVGDAALYQAFGFTGVNYGFAFILLSLVLMPVITTVFSVALNKLSRDAEYRADAQAVQEGLGEALITALKKLARDNFSNLSPSPLLVALEYSHPPIDARIQAIRSAEAARDKTKEAGT